MPAVTLTAAQWASIYADGAAKAADEFEEGEQLTKREFDRRLAEAMRPEIEEHREGGEPAWAPRGWLEG